MAYTVKQLASLAGITVRTLHHYDQIGLLQPSWINDKGYRYYEQEELLRLQQILFFRELDFSLEEIKHILSSPSYTVAEALKDQKKLLQLKIKRLNKLITTIDSTITTVTNEETMNDKDLYENFSDEEMKHYADEAKERWGHTEAYKQSQERLATMGKEGLEKVISQLKELEQKIAAAMQDGLASDSDEVQELIAQHYEGLRAFYEPNLEMYQGLAEMYVSDERFTAHYEKVAEGLAQFMHDGMVVFVESSLQH